MGAAFRMRYEGIHQPPHTPANPLHTLQIYPYNICNSHVLLTPKFYTPLQTTPKKLLLKFTELPFNLKKRLSDLPPPPPPPPHSQGPHYKFLVPFIRKKNISITYVYILASSEKGRSAFMLFFTGDQQILFLGEDGQVQYQQQHASTNFHQLQTSKKCKGKIMVYQV
jgi:hypothetical protein